METTDPSFIGKWERMRKEDDKKALGKTKKVKGPFKGDVFTYGSKAGSTEHSGYL